MAQRYKMGGYGMIEVLHERIWKTDKSIIGTVSVMNDIDGFSPLFSLEHPWRDNKKNISCIQAGKYYCHRSVSTKNKEWGEAFFIKNVPGRKNIIFGHIGNRPEDTEGCVLLGMYYANENFIAASEKAIDRWMNYMKNINNFKLEIIEYF